MATTVKHITLWRRELDDKVGALADTLQPLARAGVNLQVVMAYRYPGHEEKAAIELYPIAGKKLMTAAQAAGLRASSEIPTLLVEGDDKPGVGQAISGAIAGAGINMTFLMAQVVGRRHSTIVGFETEADARKAATLIKKVIAERAPAAKKRS